ncbi:MAG: hypothetical protein F6J95_004270 [Leptolyngbya sp. SIO1E4]|nr:hypothetical protein [Leptolyngbya sp. SIO1E4]
MSKLYTFPEDFLRKTAITHNLSDPESEVFRLRFGDGLNNAEITKQHSLPKDTLHKRFGEIYQKYEVSGKGKGKDNELLKKLDQEFEAFRRSKRQEKEMSDFGREREHDSTKYQLQELWDALDQLRKDMDTTSTSNYPSESLSFSGSLDSVIDIYIEKLENTNQPTNKILKDLFNQAPEIVEKLAINSHLKEREIAVLLLKSCKSLIQEISNKEIPKSEAIQDCSIEIFPSSEETIDLI